MRSLLIAMAVMLVTGCAGTSKTAAVPDAEQAGQPQSLPAAGPATSASASTAPAEANKGVEARHEELDTLVKAPANLKTSYQGFEPYQCAMVWTRGMQQNLNPWLKTCDTRTQKN